jgi:hypothetical protein
MSTKQETAITGRNLKKKVSFSFTSHTEFNTD